MNLQERREDGGLEEGALVVVGYTGHVDPVVAAWREDHERGESTQDKVQPPHLEGTGMVPLQLHTDRGVLLGHHPRSQGSHNILAAQRPAWEVQTLEHRCALACNPSCDCHFASQLKYSCC
jgi:hypothetical protein